jgi:hypothetical protein
MASGYDPMGGAGFPLATKRERVCAEITLQ